MTVTEQIDRQGPADDRWFQLLLETLPHIAFLIGPDGRAIAYNQRFTDYLGTRPNEAMIERTALHHPDDHAHLDQIRAESAVPGREREYVTESRLRRHDGAYRWHRIHIKPLFRNHICVGWLGTAVDIQDVREQTEILEQRVLERTAALEQANQRLQAEIEQRRESEARYRTLYNRTPMALQSVDANARLIDVNDTWTTLFGYEREAVIGRSPYDFMTADSAARYREQSWPAMLGSAGEVRTVDYQFRAADGRIFDGRLAARGEFDHQGRFIRSWSAIADVTAEKRADRELRQAQRMEAIGQLTAGIAHDFNNLLTAILGNLEMLEKKTVQPTPRTLRLLAGARSAAQRGASLTAQLLAFSRQQRIVAMPLDLNQIVQETLPLLRSTIGGAIRIETACDPTIWRALGDTTQLQLAVLNLAINARDAMPQGGTLTIATANDCRGEPAFPEEPSPGAYVVVSVTDTGSGMPDAVRDRIFEPFFTTKDVGRGSGLGLPQVLGVAKQLGGGIVVQTTPGQGTRVSICLPRAEATGAASSAVVTTSPPKPTGPRAARILVVDDDEAVRVVAADILREAGYVVTEVATGAEALDCLRQGGPTAAMIVDVVMPAMTGPELAAIVHRDQPSLPVIFMTGYATRAMLPADTGLDVLRKPFQASELAAKVAQAISRTAR